MKILKNRNSFLVRISVSSVFLSLLAVPISPAAGSSDYSLTKTLPASSFQANIARANGYIYGFKDSKNIYAFDESSDTVTSVITATPVLSPYLIAAGSYVIGATSAGYLYYIQTGGTTFQQTPYQPCGNSWNQGNALAAGSNFILVTCYVNKTMYLFDTTSTPTLVASAKTTWTPIRAAILNGYAYVGDTASPYNVRKFSLASFNSPTYTADPFGETTTPLSTTSIPAGLDIGSVPLNFHMISDANYIWTISASPTAPYKIVRIDGNTNSVTTIMLNDFTSGSSPRYAISSISSDGATLFISFSGNVTVVGLDIATSSPSILATPAQAAIQGIQYASRAFWVSGSTGVLRYSLPLLTTTDVSAESLRKRQAEIDAARNALVAKIKAGETIVNSDLIAADVTELNTDLTKRANGDFQIAAKSKGFGFADVKTIITKWSIYQDIQYGNRRNVTGRLAYQAGIIPSSVKMKQTLIAQVMNSDASERSSVEKIDALIATLAKKQSDQQNRKVTIINKITSGK